MSTLTKQQRRAVKALRAKGKIVPSARKGRYVVVAPNGEQIVLAREALRAVLCESGVLGPSSAVIRRRRG